MVVVRRALRIGLAMALLLVALGSPASADEAGTVKVNAVFTDYPENLEETPWDIGCLKGKASEPDKGTLRADNPYSDWNYVKTLDPEDFGLDPDTDLKQLLKDQLKDLWLEIDVVCVNVIDNRAVVGGQVVRVGGAPFLTWVGTWIGIEFFDMDAYGQPDYYEDLRYDPDTGQGQTESDVRSWCGTGDVPVPPDWFYYQRELLSGGIEISQ